MSNVANAVSLHKAYKTDKSYLLYIVDKDDYFDYYTATLDNRDMLRIIAQAYKEGYTDFVVGISVIEMNQPKDIIVLTVDGSNITVNWDIVRKLTKEEWNA